jgi:hypothetical protein
MQRCRIVDKEQRHYISLYAVRAESVAEEGQERLEEERG